MGVPVTGTITTTAPGDTYATIDPLYGIDGWRSVADASARNSITTLRRREGMAVWTRSDDKLWTLNPAPWAGTDGDWTEFQGGSGTGTVTSVSVVTANGVSGSVATATTTPAITLTLGDITPTSIGSATTVTTQSPGDNTTKIASTAFVTAAVAALTSGLTFVPPGCRVATTAALTATYANGTLGVGATLTNSGTQVALTIDGVLTVVSDVVLVKDQAAPAQNGIYTVTTVGTGATNWVLTRATNYDQLAEITTGSYTAVGAGTVNTGTLWIMTGTSPITVGTTAVVFTTLTLTGTGTVSTVSVVTANGVSATVANPTTTPALTFTLGAITPTSIGSATVATTQSPGDNSTKLATTAFVTAAIAAAGGSGTVTAVSVATANGYSGTVANATTTPQITIIPPIIGIRIDQHYGTIGVASIVSTNATFDLSTHDWYSLTLDHTATTTLILSNPTVGQQFTLRLIQDSFGSCLVTWFSGIRWTSGAPPTLSTGSGTIDTITFKCVSSGVYDGFVTGASAGGTVTAFSFVDANGFTGTVSNPTTTPALTLLTAPGGLPTGTAGQVLIWNSTVAAFSSIIEVKSATSPNATGTASVALNADGATASGNQSFACGESTTAGGDFSHAEGISTVASGNQSHAEGNTTTASSSSAHAEGWSTNATATAAHAEGEFGTAGGEASHAEGSGTTASGDYSHAEGNSSTASNTAAHAEGDSIASGQYSHSEGLVTTASGFSSHAEGSGSVAYGSGSHAEGESLALGDTSHAEGGAASYGNHAHGEGTNSSGAGEASHAEGENCWAGPTPWACSLATTGGVTVATITGSTEAATWFAHLDHVVLFTLSGGTGSNFVTATVNTSAVVGSDSVITLTAEVTDATTGEIFVPKKSKHGHAGGLNSFADLPTKFARSDGGFWNGSSNPSGSTCASTTCLSVKTTDATETELRIGGGVGASPTPVRFLIADGFTYGFELSLVARKSDGSASALMRRQGLLHRDSGTVALIGDVGTLGADINTPGWVLKIVADNTNKSLKVTGTGASSTTILWFAELRTWEVGLPSGPFRAAPLT